MYVVESIDIWMDQYWYATMRREKVVRFFLKDLILDMEYVGKLGKYTEELNQN